MISLFFIFIHDLHILTMRHNPSSEDPRKSIVGLVGPVRLGPIYQPDKEKRAVTLHRKL